MSKAVLIVDMPENCSTCQLCIPVALPYCSATGEKLELQKNIRENHKPDWCPLKPAPKKNVKKGFTSSDIGWINGWNACVKQIGAE